MSGTITTSIRLDAELRRALELRAQKEKRGKNLIISRALENYLEHDAQLDLAAEAHRQSQIAAQAGSIDWAEDADFSQWKLKQSQIMVDKITAARRDQVRERIGKIGPAQLTELEASLLRFLGFNAL